MTGPSLLELLVACCVLDLFDPEILVKIMWYVPPTISGGGNDFLGGSFFLFESKPEIQGGKGSEKWPLRWGIVSLNKQRASNLQRLRTTKSPLSNTDRDLLYVDAKQGNFSGNFRFAIEISTLKLDMNFFWAEGLRNINFGCGPLPACGDCQLLLGGGHTKQIPLLTKVTSC